MLFYSISTFLILFHSVVALPKKVQPQSRAEYQSWTLPSDFSSFDQFDIIQFDSTGKENCQIQTSGIPGQEDGNSVIQAFYPKGEFALRVRFLCLLLITGSPILLALCDRFHQPWARTCWRLSILCLHSFGSQ